MVRLASLSLLLMLTVAGGARAQERAEGLDSPGLSLVAPAALHARVGRGAPRRESLALALSAPVLVAAPHARPDAAARVPVELLGAGLSVLVLGTAMSFALVPLAVLDRVATISPGSGKEVDDDVFRGVVVGTALANLLLAPLLVSMLGADNGGSGAAWPWAYLGAVVGGGLAMLLQLAIGGSTNVYEASLASSPGVAVGAVVGFELGNLL